MLPQRLKEQRKINNKTQDDVAKILNVSRSNYGLYEAGKQSPPIEKLALISEFFNVSVDYLIGNSEKQVVDVVETVQFILNNMAHNNAVMNGKEMNQLALDLMACSLENAIKTSRIIEGNV